MTHLLRAFNAGCTGYPHRLRMGTVFGQSRSNGSMRSAATKRSSRRKPFSQTGRSRSSKGELVMQMRFTPANSMQRSM